MLTTFITIAGNTSSGWDVFKKSFPSKNAHEIARETLEHFSDQESAVAAAKKIAVACQLTYVAENIGVIILSPYFGYYMPTLLTPADEVIRQGTTRMEDLDEAIKESQEKAKQSNSVFVLFKPVTVRIAN